MKIASYNIWNSKRGMPLREQQIFHEIRTINADIIGLQEVTKAMYHKITNELNLYEYHYFNSINKEDDGQLVLSKYPIISKTHIDYAIFTTCLSENHTYLVVNVHLPWDSSIQKEQLIVKIIQQISEIGADHALLLGDFNCSENSSVHHYLTGERSLLNTEANPFWVDLAEVYTDITHLPSEKTLNLRKNPRWKAKPYSYVSARLDRIYLRDPFPKSPPVLHHFSLFGKKIDEKSGYAASDHYGVLAELHFK